MAAESGSVWAIDIGNNSLKALHLKSDGEVVEVIGFDNIRHSKILNGAGVKPAEKDELIAISLRQFAKQNDIGKESLAISVPSQNSFARFVTLPPFDLKRTPLTKLVKMEAEQQIPFDIEDVQWDWQLMSQDDSSDIKVGIFAIKNEVVTSVLDYFGGENLAVSHVQMVPMALYNYVLFDRGELLNSEDRAVVVLDIGAENTDLVVCTPTTVWQRCIAMGGNAFTRAIAETFKLNFEKAEKLKRTAPMSKYARQVFQAMRPVFTDLASEIQRSLGFYSSSNPNAKLAKIIATGGGTKMRGLLKYLQQTLQIPVERPDAFRKLAISPDVSAAKFHESVCDFGAVYGLAIQGLGLAKIKSNLLPRSIARSMIWASKTKWFIGAACMLLLVSLMCFGRTSFDRIRYNNNNQARQKVSGIINEAKQAKSKLDSQKGKARTSEAVIQKSFEPFNYRDIVPLMHELMFSVLPNEKNNPGQAELYQAFAAGDVEKILQIPRKERKQIFITNMSVYFAEDVSYAAFGSDEFRMGGGRQQQQAVPGMGMPPGMMGMPFGMPGMPGASKFQMKKIVKKDEEGKVTEEQTGPGFVVSIAGYSPYGDIGELLDPAGAGNDKDKWGVVTRLMNLDEIFDGNSPFKLYRKADVQHFKLETGEVEYDSGMPTGIGIEELIEDSTKKGSAKGGTNSDKSVLIDPMTRELISKVPVLDEHGMKKMDRSGVIYEVNDNWFVLDLKFVWKDAPVEKESEEKKEKKEKKGKKEEEEDSQQL